MPFAFAEICTLLSRLEDIELRDPPFLYAAEKVAHIKTVIESWFKSHRAAINGLDVDQTVALLSTLLPERRTDRVYGIQGATLHKILSRCLGLSAARARDLAAYKQPGNGDLALCLERVLKSGGPPAHPTVTLDEVDDMLATLAGRSRFSGPNVRLPPGSSEDRDRVIDRIVKRLDPSQGKWLVRLILKDFSPVRLNDVQVLSLVHFLLPDLLRFQNNFQAAVRQLKGPLKYYPQHPDPRSGCGFRESAAVLLKPLVGVKVGRPTYFKARSIDSCLNMCGKQQWVLERKYDGEYCEIHIDMARSQTPAECITIFSKSGKDSTEDRQGIVQTLIDCLQLDRAERKVHRQAILLGELLVYSDREKRVLPFENVRKHVSRSGVFLGTDVDSPPQLDEHLAIVFFDLLLLDDEVVMAQPLEARRKRLKEIYVKIKGQSMGAEWKLLHFRDAGYARRTLIQQFVASIVERCEGLVLKPYAKPYFSLTERRDGAVDGYIKLKKDYIEGMGDEADFAVIGGGYDAQQALNSGVLNLRWTTFYLGCLLNKDELLRFGARPRFKVVRSIQAEHCIPTTVLQAASTLGEGCAEPYEFGNPPMDFDIEALPNMKMDTVFSDPMIFEVLGSGYEKPSNCNFFMLRHPRVKKLHRDRSWKDCVSMQELQAEAVASRDGPFEGESQETKKLIEKLETKCRKKRAREGFLSPRSRTTTTPSTSTRSRATGDTPLIRSGGSAKRRRSSASSAKENILDGTTLINDVSPKNERHHQRQIRTPCPTSKRHRRQQVHTQHGGDAAVSPEATQVPMPLTDITNTAHGALESSPVEHQPVIALHAVSSSPTALTALSLSPPQHKCADSRCIFANAVIYPSPCIASTPYIMQNLLGCHDAIITPTLAYWDRDSLASPPLTAIVSESQAHGNMRKIVLVEGRRDRALKQTLEKVLALNHGRCRERIEVWDWRILESSSCAGHDPLGKDAESLRCFLGATRFDEGEGRMVFGRRVGL